MKKTKATDRKVGARLRPSVETDDTVPAPDFDGDLPEGWTVSTLERLTQDDGLFVDGDWIESKDQDPFGGVRLVQLADVGDGAFRNRSSRFLTAHKASELGCTLLKKGDLLVARMPEPLGRACVFPGDPKPSVTAVDVCIVRPSPSRAEPRWLLHAINAPQFRGSMEPLAKGTTRKRISRTALGELPIPLPPVSEQKRIVAKVEEVLAPVNAARDHLARVPALLKRFRQSILAAACSGRLTEGWQGRRRRTDAAKEPAGVEGPFELPSGWTWRRFGELLTSIRSGTTSVPESAPTPFAVLRSSSVRPGSIDLTDVRYLANARDQKEANYLCAGDLLFTRLSGSLEFVGNCARVPDLGGRRILYPDRLFCAKMQDPSRAGFFEMAFRAPFVQAAFADVAKSSAGHQRISMGAITEQLMPCPPAIEQDEIVRRVDALFALADSIEQRVADATARANALTQATLAKAFRGELVSTEAELSR